MNASDTNTATVTSYYGFDLDATVPTTIDNRVITGFGILQPVFNPVAFGGVVPTNVTLPGALTSIGNEAFLDCAGIQAITIPAGVTNIGSMAFEGCTDLTNIVIPDAVSNLEGSAFEACTSLRTVTIGVGVAAIRGNTFSICSNLVTVTVVGNVTNIASSAFGSCPRLSSIYFHGNAPAVSSNVFFGVTAYYLPDTIGWDAFSAISGAQAVLWNPTIQTGGANFGIQNSQFGFNITATNNISVVVEASANPAGPLWSPLQTVTLTNGSFYFSEPLQPGSSGRYYRLSPP